VSLIDVMMLLLVIFMITAPMMAGGIEVALPQADGRPLESKSTIVVTVTGDRVYVDQDALTDAEFRSSFRALLGTRGQDGVYVQADRSASIQRWLDVSDVIRNAGVDKVYLVTMPRERPGR
jgi:biopolymer transport protein ExbD